jgi:hypothetical protein
VFEGLIFFSKYNKKIKLLLVVCTAEKRINNMKKTNEMLETSRVKQNMGKNLKRKSLPKEIKLNLSITKEEQSSHLL